VTCRTHLCSSHKCTPCTAGGQCASGTCMGGVCLLPAGAPCATDTDCIAGCGFTKFCDPTTPCTLTTCPFHACPMQLCASCNGSGDCYMNTPCTNGQCLAPPGTFCSPTSGVQCTSGTCPAPDFLDFPKCK
jgi:hypothetical protein